VSVLSSDDPVRVFQQHATVDLIWNGRAEIMAGRVSFIGSFPLFGYELDDYDALFDEKLRLLLELRESEVVRWAGTHRPSLDDRGVYPRPVQEPIPVWLAVGGNPPSVIRAASLGVPMALAIIGGRPARFAPLIDLTAPRSLPPCAPGSPAAPPPDPPTALTLTGGADPHRRRMPRRSPPESATRFHARRNLSGVPGVSIGEGRPGRRGPRRAR
jgi:hypothetical protein